MFGFSMSKEQKMIKDEVAKFVRDIVADQANDMDETRGRSPLISSTKYGPLGLPFPKCPKLMAVTE